MNVVRSPAFVSAERIVQPPPPFGATLSQIAAVGEAGPPSSDVSTVNVLLWS